MPFSIAGPASPAIPSLDGINRATDRISSGLRTNYQEQAAEAAIAGRLDSLIGETTVGIRNAINQTSALQKADQTLSQGKELTERIQELSVQASSTLLSESDQLAIQQETTGLIQNLDSLFRDARFNDSELFSSVGLDVSGISQRIAELDPSATLDDLDALTTEFAAVQAEIGGKQSGLDQTIEQQLQRQLDLESQRSAIGDADFASEVANLIKEQLLFEASVKAFDQQRMAESTIIELLN